MTTAPVLLDQYRTTAEAWANSPLDHGANQANKLFRRLHSIYKQLRTQADGRDGIAALMDHPAVGVRVIAATHSLAWAPDRATRVLEAIAADRAVGLEGVTAEYTLIEYRKGTLNLDW